MRQFVSIAIACALPLTGCTLLGKAGITANGKSLTSSSPSPATAPAASPASSGTAAAKAPASAPLNAQAPVPPPAANGKPIYCLPNKSYFSSLDDQELPKDHRYSARAVHELAEGTCEKAKPEKRAKIDANIQNFVQVTGLSPAETHGLFALYLNMHAAQKSAKAFCQSLAVDDEDLASNREKAYKTSLGRAFGCSRTGNTSYDWPDQDIVAKGLDVAICLQNVNQRVYGGSSKPRPRDMLNYGKCRVMATGFHPQAALQAVRAAAFPLDAKAEFITILSSIAPNQALLEPIFKKYADKDDAYKAFIFDAPMTAYQQWQKTYASNKALMDEMHYILSHGDNKYLMKKVLPCSEKFFPMVKSIAKVSGANNIAELRTAFGAPKDGMVIASYAMCQGAEKHSWIASYYKNIANLHFSEGPLDAAYKASVGALLQHRGDIKDAEHMTINSDRFEFPNWRSGGFETRKATIQSVKKSGDTIHVSFRKETWKEPIIKCRETRRIDSIRNGRIVYRQKCKQTGKKTTTSQERPIDFPALHASHLKAGQFLIFSKPHTGGIPMPLRSYKSKAQKTILAIFGLPL